MNNAVTLSALAAVLLAAAPAAAKEHMAKDHMAKEHELNQSDRTFVEDSARGNLAEVQMGILAASHGSTATVREFGRWMISTHSFANRQLAAISERSHGEAPSLKPDAKVKDTMGRLQNLKGVEFDKAYLGAMAAHHDEDKKALGAEARDGQDPQVKGYAANFLPTVDEHFAEVTLLLADTDGGGHTGAEANANMKAAVGGMGATPQGNTDQAKDVQKQHSGK